MSVQIAVRFSITEPETVAGLLGQPREGKAATA